MSYIFKWVLWSCLKEVSGISTTLFASVCEKFVKSLQFLGDAPLTMARIAKFSPKICKVNSVQEASAKCFVVHLLELEILQATWKHKTKNIKMLDLLGKNWKLRVWCSMFHFFYVIFKISNFNMWTAKHLAEASCTGLALISKWRSFWVKNWQRPASYF